jgi:hypothetical protein
MYDASVACFVNGLAERYFGGAFGAAVGCLGG